MTDAIEDLHATADDLAADADRLRDIEARKAGIGPDDPELVPLADEAKRLSREMASKAAVQRELAETVADAGTDRASD